MWRGALAPVIMEEVIDTIDDLRRGLAKGKLPPGTSPWPPAMVYLSNLACWRNSHVDRHIGEE